MPPFSVDRIDHIVLPVADMERSVAFYVGVLGLRVERRRGDLGLVQLRAGASIVDLVSLEGALGAKGGGGPGPEGRNLDHFCLRIEPFDEARLTAFLAGQGRVLLGRAARNYGAEGFGPSFYIADPDGNVIELKGPATSAADPGDA
jgi:catechol 2,3-dioxygenase-like lactoylglutathione lyase family enzyme